MNSAVFDTNILIHFSNGIEAAQNIIQKTENRYISIISWMEFLIGVPPPKLPEAKKISDRYF